MNFFSVCIFLVLSVSISFCQWSSDPSKNTRVTHGGLLPQILSDGTGGAYIVYQDSPALLRQLWVQRLDRYGFVRFPDNGIRVSSPERNQTPDYFLVSDSVGGVIVAFRDFREIDEGTRSAVYVQRVDSLGRKLWGDAGIGVRDDQVVVSACSDGNQGVFVFWSEGPTPTGFQLRAQRINAVGELQWPQEGVTITAEFTSFNIPMPATAVSDGLDNAIVLYSDSSGTKLQKVSGQGELLWDEGVSIFPVGRQMIGDNFGGAIVAGVRQEFDGVSVKYIVGAQSIGSSGQVLWGKKGVIVEDSLNDRTNLSVALGKDAEVTLVWQQSVNGIDNVFLNKIAPIGTLIFDEKIEPSGYKSRKVVPKTISSTNGAVIVIWYDFRNGDGGLFVPDALFAQQIDKNGSPRWDTLDVAVSNSEVQHRSYQVISDNDDGVIVSWYETGVGSGFGIFAQQVSRNGELGEVLITSVSEPYNSIIPSQYVLHQSYPNPFNAEMLIRYEIPNNNHVRLTIFDITGKEVITLINKNQPPGTYRVKWNGKDHKGGEVASGIYFYQLRVGSFVETKKALLIQ